ncbi:DUF262 domain-containing protein, partial [Halomonas sp. BC04]|uniref:DUF262 domain-containing protein n=1 Tax=Halomonas sp. BC04 TaxID=1403540 RepID=UPI0003ED8229
MGEDVQGNFGFPNFTDERIEAAEKQILSLRRRHDYDIREYPVGVIYDKYRNEVGPGIAELFVPDYQRDHVWLPKQKSRFIESVLLDLPIPYIYVSDVTEEEHSGLLEIVDGSQRVRTIVEFIEDGFSLTGLEILKLLEGFKFSDLPKSRQLRFKRKTLRTIELLESDEESRRELFDRLNTGGSKLNYAEQRRGSIGGPFLEMVQELAGEAWFQELCPVGQARQRRKEYEELVLRFFAFSDNYLGFDHSVNEFLDEYLKEKNESFDKEKYIERFREVMEFVKTHFPYGFRKNAKNTSVPRIRFEAISVGTYLALCENPDLVPDSMEWLYSNEFKVITSSDASNSR